MTPTTALARLPDLLASLTARLAHLRDEADAVAAEWQRLAELHADRDDHAAMLLARLRPHLRDIGGFVKGCELQIDRMVADPFGRRAGETAEACQKMTETTDE